MSPKTLAQEIKAYLDLQTFLDDYPAPGGFAQSTAWDLDLARKDILARLEEPRDPSVQPLIDATRAYLDAESDFTQCNSRCRDADSSARRMERARWELEEQLQNWIDSTDDVLQPPAVPALRQLRILIALDTSEPAQWAFQVGADIACRTSAKVLLVHAVPPPTSIVGEFVVVLEDFEAKQHNDAQALLEKYRTMLPRLVESHTMVRDGLPADEIITAAKVWEADLIVLGTHGRGRLARLLLGSTAEAVIRRATCPVITVAHPYRGAATHHQSLTPHKAAATTP
jgi:nucleotide-binding universal stress UspA family protein